MAASATIQFTGENEWMGQRPIAWKELYAIVMGLATFGSEMKSQYIAMYTDNMAIQCCINTGVCRDPAIMSLIRALYYYVTLHCIRYRSFYVSTHDNGPADSLSRNQMQRFRSLCPNADINPTRLPSVRTDF